MKKAFGLGLMIWLLSVQAYAGVETGVTLAYPITISIATDQIMLQGDTTQVSFGFVAFNNSVFSNLAQGQPRSTVKQIGWATIDYTALATISGGWSLSTVRGANIAVLYAVFTRALRADEAVSPDIGRTLVAGDFDASDILTSTARRASATSLAVNTETSAVKGYNILNVDSERSLRYRIDTPTGGLVAPQTITITIGGIIL